MKNRILNKSMKTHTILLINPWFCDFKGYDEWMKPLGLLLLSSVFKINGLEVDFINCLDSYKTSDTYTQIGCGQFNKTEISKPSFYASIKRKYKRYGISEEELRLRLSNIKKPDFILCSSLMTYWYPGVAQTIAILRETFPTAPIILGGIYASLCQSHAKSSKTADFIIPGTNINLILDNLEKYTNIEFPHRFNSFADLPFPDYELLKNPHSIPVLNTYGCPFRCSYCASSLLYPKIETKNPLKSAEELAQYLEKSTCRNIAFYDDALLINYKNQLAVFLKEICKKIPSLSFHTPNALHAALIDEKTAEELKKYNFKTLRLGYEFADTQIQKTSGGKVSTKEFEKCAQNLLKAGFEPEEISAYIMCGVPGISSKKIEEAINIVHNNGLKSMLVEFSPIPGTKIWDSFPGSGSSESEDPLFHNNTYHIYKETVIPLEEYNRLKNLSKKLNVKCENSKQNVV